MTATDKADFLHAIEAAPNDTTPCLVFGDWHEEQGNMESAAYWRRRAQAMKLSIRPWSELVAELDKANGKRRQRLVSREELIGCILDSLDGVCYVSGGTVTNAYGYPSRQTVCVAVVRSDGKVRCGCAETNANKGASPTTAVCGLAKNAKPEQFVAWADAYDK